MTSALHRTVGRRPSRRGFNLVEMLIALAITASLLSATMVALDASFMAYQSTTEQASTNVIARLVMNRIMACTRIAQESGPYPVNPQDTEICSNELQLRLPSGQLIGFTYDPDDATLYFDAYDDADVLQGQHPLLGGIVVEPDTADCDGDSNVSEPRMAFVLEYELGRELHRMCCHLVIRPDDVQHLEMEGNYTSEMTLDFCVIPRLSAYDTGPGS